MWKIFKTKAFMLLGSAFVYIFFVSFFQLCRNHGVCSRPVGSTGGEGARSWRKRASGGLSVGGDERGGEKRCRGAQSYSKSRGKM